MVITRSGYNTAIQYESESDTDYEYESDTITETDYDSEWGGIETYREIPVLSLYQQTIQDYKESVSRVGYIMATTVFILQMTTWSIYKSVTQPKSLIGFYLEAFKALTPFVYYGYVEDKLKWVGQWSSDELQLIEPWLREHPEVAEIKDDVDLHWYMFKHCYILTMVHAIVYMIATCIPLVVYMTDIQSFTSFLLFPNEQTQSVEFQRNETISNYTPYHINASTHLETDMDELYYFAANPSDQLIIDTRLFQWIYHTVPFYLIISVLCKYTVYIPYIILFMKRNEIYDIVSNDGTVSDSILALKVTLLGLKWRFLG